MTTINSFRGEYRWLSNFWLCRVVDNNGRVWRSAEHAYQAMKFKPVDEYAVSWDDMQQRIYDAATPAEAKRLGKTPGQREDWDKIKVGVMLRILRRKFSRDNPELVAKLLATGDATLVEGNSWHDSFWGSCNCGRCKRGENHLGQLLMQVREELKG